MAKPSTIAGQLEKIPFLRMLIPLIIGIITADHLVVHSGILLGILISLILFYFLFKGQRVRQTILAFTLLFMGLSVAKVLIPQEKMPRDEKLIISGIVEENISTHERWQRTTARITAFRTDNSEAQWHACNEKIFLYVDTAQRIGLGDDICAVAYINPLDSLGGTSGYARTMRSRGVLGKAYVIDGRMISCVPSQPENLWDHLLLASKKAQGGIIERLRSSGMEVRELGIAMALLAGDRTLIDPELREDYSKAGVSHILAVSGLHLGIIFLLLNYLLSLLSLVRHGRTARACIIVFSLWTYAFISGLSPSVMRAAFMLTIMQLSLFTVRSYNSYNALFASAFILLLIRPMFLYDISFQMSYISLFSILFFYPRLNRWTGVGKTGVWLKQVRNRTKGILYFPMAFLTNLFIFMTGAILIGLSAQIGVMPLVGWAFGRLPLLSILANPFIMLVITWLMVAGFAFLALMNVPFLGWLANVIMTWLIERQNRWIENIAAMPGASIERVSYSTPVLFLIYAFLLLAVTVIKYLEERKHYPEPDDVQPFA